MLKQRVITALILMIIVIAAIYWLPLFAFSIIAGALLFLVAFEWQQLLKLNARFKLGYFVALLGLMVIFYFVPNEVSMIAAVIVWVWLFNHIVRLIRSKREAYQFSVPLDAVFSWVILVGAWSSLITLRQIGSSWLLYALCVVWAADSGAYFMGRFKGKHKLANNISPKKTWEGCLGGAIAIMIVDIVAVILAQLPARDWLGLILLSLLAGAFSMIGDLYESRLKRQAGVKDSGNLLPGHGGLYDRLDGLLAALPLLGLGLLLLNV